MTKSVYSHMNIAVYMAFLFIIFLHVLLILFFYHCIYGCMFYMLLFNFVSYVFYCYVYVFLLLCTFPSAYSVFCAFSSVVRQMPEYNLQRQGTAHTLPN